MIDKKPQIYKHKLKTVLWWEMWPMGLLFNTTLINLSVHGKVPGDNVPDPAVTELCYGGNSTISSEIFWSQAKVSVLLPFCSVQIMSDQSTWSQIEILFIRFFFCIYDADVFYSEDCYALWMKFFLLILMNQIDMHNQCNLVWKSVSQILTPYLNWV